MNVLSAAALKDDVILMLHQDRKQHILMNYAYEVDRLPLPQQKGITLFVSYLKTVFFLIEANFIWQILIGLLENF